MGISQHGRGNTVSHLDWVPPLGPLAAIGAALLMHIYLEGRQSGPPMAHAPTLTETVASKEGSDLRIAPSSNVETAVNLFQSRPLLAEGRRVPEPVPPEVAVVSDEIVVAPEIAPEAVFEPEPEVAAAPEIPTVQMLGSMSNAHGDAVLIADSADGTQRWVRLGENIAGWTLVEITPVAIRLTANGVETTIDLFQ